MYEEAKDDAIIEAKISGATLGDIQNRLGVGRDKVRQILGDAGLIKPLKSNFGSGHSSAKVNPDTVREIRALAARGMSYTTIKSELSLSISIVAIFKICKLITWRHVK